MPEQSKAKAVADIVFLIDVTGSMQPFIDILKDHINRFIDSLTTSGGPNDPPPVKDWRGMVVGYRDFPHDPSNWFETKGFTKDVDELRDNIAALHASGGDDRPESLLDAIHKIALFSSTSRDAEPESMKWRASGAAHRFIIAFTDAIYHETMSYEDGEGGGVDEVMNECKTGRIKLCVFAPSADGGEEAYADLGRLDKSEIELLDGRDSEEAFNNFVSDTEAFSVIMSNLAKTVSSSVSAEELPSLEVETAEEEAAAEIPEEETEEVLAETPEEETEEVLAETPEEETEEVVEETP